MNLRPSGNDCRYRYDTVSVKTEGIAARIARPAIKIHGRIELRLLWVAREESFSLSRWFKHGKRVRHPTLGVFLMARGAWRRGAPDILGPSRLLTDGG